MTGVDRHDAAGIQDRTIIISSALFGVASVGVHQWVMRIQGDGCIQVCNGASKITVAGSDDTSFGVETRRVFFWPSFARQSDYAGYRIE